MIIVIIVAALLLLLLAVEVFLMVRLLPIIAGLFVNVTVRRVRPSDDRFEGEEVSFETADGVRLAGTLGPEPEDSAEAPIVVFCHEFSAKRQSAARYGWFLREAGYRVFAFDFRGHGDSSTVAGYEPRQWVTEHEVFDLRAALRYLRNRPDTSGRRIALLGVSRGAVAGLIVAGADPSIAGIVSDGAFCTQRTLHTYIRRWAPIFVDEPLRFILKSPDFMFAFFRWMAFKLAEHRLGVRFVSLMPALRRLRAPVLFIHGEKDSYVDAAQAHRLRDAAGARADLWIVPDADHNEAAEIAPEEYRRRVADFLRETLGAPRRRAVRQVV